MWLSATHNNQMNSRLSEGGATMVEFTFSVLVFFFFIFCSIELLRYGFTILTSQYVIQTAARQASVNGPVAADLDVNNVDPIVISNARERRAGDIIAHIRTLQAPYGLNFADAPNEISICPIPRPGQPPSCNPPGRDAGTFNDLVRIESIIRFRFVVFGIGWTTTTRTVFKNEDYEFR